MAKYNGPKCRLCRREGQKLFLKGTRCETVKCAWNRREKAPGMHTWRRGKVSDYKRQLREKQKVKRIYGVLEKQFKRYFSIAERTKGNTGQNLLLVLERRFDNVVYRGGFAISRSQARHLVGHGHLKVNGRKVDIPSMLIRPGDVVTVRDKENSRTLVKESLETSRTRDSVPWLSVEEAGPQISIIKEPAREDIEIPIEEQLVVELLSR
jgi:small subunit ribosomal protein S4